MKKIIIPILTLTVLLVLSSIAPAAETIYYYHNDHLGTPQTMTDDDPISPIKVWEADYMSFGDATVNEDPDGDSTTVSNNLRFPGQYYDNETGYYYNYQRTYDPAIGRYLEADPIGIQEGMNHLYVYVRNNPINFIDPLGLYGTNDCSFYQKRCEETGGEYYCEKAKKYCNWFPKYPDPDPKEHDDFEGWSRCVRQCLQDCDEEKSCEDKDSSATDSFWDWQNFSCHSYCYRNCSIWKVFH